MFYWSCGSSNLRIHSHTYLLLFCQYKLADLAMIGVYKLSPPRLNFALLHTEYAGRCLYARAWRKDNVVTPSTLCPRWDLTGPWSSLGSLLRWGGQGPIWRPEGTLQKLVFKTQVHPHPKSLSPTLYPAFFLPHVRNLATVRSTCFVSDNLNNALSQWSL